MILLVVILIISFIVTIITGPCLYNKKNNIVIRGGYSENYYPQAYKNAWRVNLTLLRLREIFNVHCWKMYNTKEYIWKHVGDPTRGSYFEDPSILEKRPPLLLHNMNRKFEGFFYTNAGESLVKEYFPFGPDLDEVQLDKMFKMSEYYNTKNVCHCPLTAVKDRLKNIPNIIQIVRKGFELHGISPPDDVVDYESTCKFTEKLYRDNLKEVVKYFKKVKEYKLQPDISYDNDNPIFYIQNPDTDYYPHSNMDISYDPEYPKLFRARNRVNTKLTGGEDKIDKLLGIVTLSHMPVFTNTHFKGKSFHIRKSPGLMTSPLPNVNKAMRELPWVRRSPDKKIDVPFWRDKDGPPNYFLESYASPLNHNAEVFCSLFPTDMYANGCIGKFDGNLIQYFKKINWVPKIIMANPPYANEQFYECNRITDLAHKEHNIITITTISRRDNTLFDAMMKETPRPLSYITPNAEAILKIFIESPYYWNMYIIPESVFPYACLFTDKIFNVSSRKGERPTDSILIFKTSNKELSRMDELEKLFIDGSPKDDGLRIEPDDLGRVVEDIEARRDIQGINKNIMNEAFIKKLIRNMNMMVSGRP